MCANKLRQVKVQAVDLGGGFGAHSISLAQAGAQVTMMICRYGISQLQKGY